MANPELNELAYLSNLVYQRIAVNQTVVVPSNSVVVVTHNLGYIPKVRIWGELFVGEVGFLYVDSAQYTFGSDYFNNNIFGFIITVDSTKVTIDSESPTRNVYVRVYR